MTAAQSLSEQLKQSGDFLAITRAFPDALPETFTFELAHGNKRILVKVIATGIISFEPINIDTSKDIVLSSAVHGNETAPIEICADLIQQLIQGKLSLAERVLFIFGNPPSINLGERFVEENLNRLFSGAHLQGDINHAKPERERAALLEQAIKAFYQQGDKLAEQPDQRERFHYDLHTAIRGSKNDKFAVYPFRHEQPWKKQQLQFLKACGITTILLSHSPTTTFSYFSSNEFGADAFTVELGKVKPFGENNMENFAAVKQTLQQFISGQVIELKPYQADDFSVYEIYQTINRQGQNFVLHFADDVENFTEFEQDFVLATDDEIAHKVKRAGEAIIFPNANVAIGQRALLTVTPTIIE